MFWHARKLRFNFLLFRIYGLSLPWVPSNVTLEWLGVVRDRLREQAGSQEIAVGVLFIIVVELSVPLPINGSQILNLFFGL